MRGFCSFFALMALVAGAFAQQMSIADLLKLGSHPHKIVVRDLPVGYSAVSIMTTSGADYMSMYMPMMIVSSMGSSSSDLLSAVGSHWTAGEIIVVEGNRFLVTYKMDFDYSSINNARINSSEGMIPDFPTEMTLQLVKVDAISVLSPNPEFTRERLLALVQGKSMPTQPDAPVASKKTATISNLKQVALGMLMYSGDYDDEFPYAQNTATVQHVTYPYVKNKSIWTTHNPNGGRILFNMALGGVNATAIDNPSTTPMFFDEKFWPDGSRIVAYADGHVRVVQRSEWANIEKELRKRWKRKGKPLPLPPSGSPIMK